MKKVFCLVLCVLLIASISGCNKTKGPYAILPMEQVGGKVDTEIIDRFLTDSDYYPSYGELKNNRPTILSKLVNVTPEALKDKCSIYRFLYSFDMTSCSGKYNRCYEPSKGRRGHHYSLYICFNHSRYRKKRTYSRILRYQRD